MPYDQVMHKFKHGDLHSGSKHGPEVKSRAQAIAIMMSEKQKAEGGKKEYQPKKMQHGGLVPMRDKPEYPGDPKDKPAEALKEKKKAGFKTVPKMAAARGKKPKRGFASIR